MPDAHANFAYSTVATAPSPATSGTSLVVASGEGANFPAVPFNAVVCPAGTQPTNANAEIIRVTARSTDTFSTIVRQQEGTNARTIVAGDQIFAAVTAKSLTDIEAGQFDRQVFTASGTWTKPAGMRRVRVIIVGGGGGGASGRHGLPGTGRAGGGGGSGAGYEEALYWAADLPATVAVTVGAGGAGGAAPADSTTGNNGGVGGATTFGSLLTAAAGTFGFGGNTTVGAASFASSLDLSNGAAAGLGVGVAPSGVAGHPWRPPGGASGAGVSAANVPGAGVAGRTNTAAIGTATGAAGGTSPGGNAGTVASPVTLAAALYAANPAYGGASGAGSDVGGGGKGGDAQGYGAGGGGGGGGTDTFTMGTGGAGGGGLCIVESWV